jgi:hypothetical protein
MKCTHLPRELNRYSSEYTMVVLPHPCGALMPICPHHTPHTTPQKYHNCVSGSGTNFPYILVSEKVLALHTKAMRKHMKQFAGRSTLK